MVRTASLPLALYGGRAWCKPIKLWVPAQNPLTGSRFAQLLCHLLLAMSSDCVFFGPCTPADYSTSSSGWCRLSEARKACSQKQVTKGILAPYQATEVHLVNSIGAILHDWHQPFFFLQLVWFYWQTLKMTSNNILSKNSGMYVQPTFAKTTQLIMDIFFTMFFILFFVWWWTWSQRSATGHTLAMRQRRTPVTPLGLYLRNHIFMSWHRRLL